MKIQRQLTDKRGDKKYYKYVAVIPEKTIKEAGFKEGDDLEPVAKKGEIRLRKR